MLTNIIAVDTETNGKDIRDGQGFCIGISCAIYTDGAFYAAYFPVAHTAGNVEEETKKLLFHIIATRSTVIMHNAKFDLISLKTAGFTHQLKRWYCTMLMAHMLNENVPKGLDWLARNELKEPGKKKPPIWEAWFKIFGWSPEFPADVMALYACEDAVLALKLFFRLITPFVKSGFDGDQSTM